MVMISHIKLQEIALLFIRNYFWLLVMKMQLLLANEFLRLILRKKIIVNNLKINKSSYKVLTFIISFSSKCHSIIIIIKKKEPEIYVSF